MIASRITRNVKEVLSTSVTEARIRSDARVGPEHILLALMHDAQISSRYLGGQSAAEGRRALAELDRAALRSVGIEPPEQTITSQIGPRQLDFTHGAKDAIDRTLRIAAARRSRRVEARDLLTAVVSQTGPSTAIELLHQLAIEPAEVLSALHAA